MKIQRIFLCSFLSILLQVFCVYKYEKSGMTFGLGMINSEHKNPEPTNSKSRKLNKNKNEAFYNFTNTGDSSIIYGNSSSLTYFYVNLYIGSPPQKQSVIIDTGSHMTAIPCQPFCENCGSHINPHYDTNKSNSSSILQCESNKCKQFSYTKCEEKTNQCGYSMVKFYFLILELW